MGQFPAAPSRRRRRRLSRLLARSLVLTLLPRESGVRPGADVAMMPAPILAAAAESPPPPVEPLPPAAVEMPPAIAEPPPVVVEMPPPIPGPPLALSDLTPEERMMILARPGLESPHRVRVASPVKVLETGDPDWRERRVVPAVPIDAPAPALPAAAVRSKAEWTAIALVHVARDGTTTDVRTTKPVADEAVNRALEEAIRGWRFRATFTSSLDPWPWFAPTAHDSIIELRVKTFTS